MKHHLYINYCCYNCRAARLFFSVVIKDLRLEDENKDLWSKDLDL